MWPFVSYKENEVFLICPKDYNYTPSFSLLLINGVNKLKGRVIKTVKACLWKKTLAYWGHL